MHVFTTVADAAGICNVVALPTLQGRAVRRVIRCKKVTMNATSTSESSSRVIGMARRLGEDSLQHVVNDFLDGRGLQVKQESRALDKHFDVHVGSHLSREILQRKVLRKRHILLSYIFSCASLSRHTLNLTHFVQFC